MKKINEYDNLDIGDFIEATALSQCRENSNSKTWEGFSKQISPKWDLKLIISSNGDAQPGYTNIFRIINIWNGKIIAINSIHYGSKPLTSEKDGINKKIKNFIESIRQNILTINIKIFIMTLKSIKKYYLYSWQLLGISRFEYYNGLGKPNKLEQKEIILIIDELINELKNENINTEIINELKQRLLKTNIINNLLHFIEYLGQKEEKLCSAVYGKNYKQTVLDKNNVKRIMSQLEKEKRSWAISEHEKTLQILISKLKELTYIPEEGLFIDCFSCIKTGPAIFEIKSLTETNELHQIRAAISQLYEYSYRHNYPNASLWIVLSRKPEIEWIVDYLLNARKINVLWVENGILVGPSLKLL